MENENQATRLITLAEIEAAATRIAPYVQPSPLVAMTPSRRRGRNAAEDD